MTDSLAVDAPLVRTVKRYVSEARHRIALDDLVTTELTAANRALADEAYPVGSPSPDADSIAARLESYETQSARLVAAAALIARWGTTEHLSSLVRVVRGLSPAESAGGYALWTALRWYPAALVLYSAGLAAVSGERYDSLAKLVLARLPRTSPAQRAVHRILGAISDADSHNPFKALRGYGNKHFPRSEYLYDKLKPGTALFVADDEMYDEAFDRLEILLALSYTDEGQEEISDVWGPPGRFVWKRKRSLAGGPFASVVAEARMAGNAWPPLAAGFFNGSLERFTKLAAAYERGLQWRGT